MNTKLYTLLFLSLLLCSIVNSMDQQRTAMSTSPTSSLSSSEHSKISLQDFLYELHEKSDEKKAAERLSFAQKVKASQRVARKKAQAERKAEEDIKRFQEDNLGCIIS